MVLTIFGLVFVGFEVQVVQFLWFSRGFRILGVLGSGVRLEGFGWVEELLEDDGKMLGSPSPNPKL